MRRVAETFELEKDYNGFVLCTDGRVFFTRDEEGNRLFEAKSLDALKSKCRTPKKLDIQAVILARYDYYSDDDESTIEPQKVHVYGVSPTGAFLYEHADGTKDKSGRYSSDLRALKVSDGADIAMYVSLRKAKIAANKALNEFLKKWPRMDSKNYLDPEADK